jgi:hypothetical protein
LDAFREKRRARILPFVTGALAASCRFSKSGVAGNMDKTSTALRIKERIQLPAKKVAFAGGFQERVCLSAARMPFDGASSLWLIRVAWRKGWRPQHVYQFAAPEVAAPI